MTPEVFEGSDNATPLTVDEQPALIPSLSTRAELNQLERLNINTARVWAMRKTVLARADLLSDAFARELHRRMFNQMWQWAGQYRSTEKNIGWAVPRLAEGVRNAFDDARAWLEHSTYPPAESAVRLHHRLVLIHPWSNGNGRHARLMADIMVAANGGKELTWGAGHDLAAAGEVRGRYIAAVQLAAQGDFRPLVAFAQS